MAALACYAKLRTPLATAHRGLTQALGRMSDHFVLIVAVFVCGGILATLLFRRSLLAKAIGIFLITYPLGIWALLLTYSLYQQDMAPTISRHNTAVLLSSNPTYGKVSLVFHLALGLFMLCAGTYFGIRRLRDWHNAA